MTGLGKNKKVRKECAIVHTRMQGGIIFGISWEPNFPVNNFA